MVTALNPVLDDAAEAQRRRAVAATVSKPGGVSILLAEQDNRFAQDATGERLVGDDFVGPGGDVPGVAREHACGLLFPPVRRAIRPRRIPTRPNERLPTRRV